MWLQYHQKAHKAVAACDCGPRIYCFNIALRAATATDKGKEAHESPFSASKWTTARNRENVMNTRS